MLDWTRQIIDYYRDRFLLGPILLFSLLAIASVVAPESPADRLYGFKLTACAVIAVILARERLAIILAGAAFVTVRLAGALAVTRDWKVYGASLLVSIGILVALFPIQRRRKPSYEDPPKTSIPGGLFVVVGIVAAVAIVLLLKPLPEHGPR
jgi:hypothetical protein